MTPETKLTPEQEAMIEAEEWREVKNFARYKISNTGKVIGARGKLITPKVDTHGYKSISLSIGNYKQISKKVHRIVAEAFITNPENKPQVNHKNGIRTDNRVENLEWATNSDNQRHAVDVLKRSFSSGESHATALLKENQVIEIRKSNKTHRELAKLYGVSKSTIGAIKIGRIWKQNVIAKQLISPK